MCQCGTGMASPLHSWVERLVYCSHVNVRELWAVRKKAWKTLHAGGRSVAAGLSLSFIWFKTWLWDTVTHEWGLESAYVSMIPPLVSQNPCAVLWWSCLMILIYCSFQSPFNHLLILVTHLHFILTCQIHSINIIYARLFQYTVAGAYNADDYGWLLSFFCWVFFELLHAIILCNKKHAKKLDATCCFWLTCCRLVI